MFITFQLNVFPALNILQHTLTDALPPAMGGGRKGRQAVEGLLYFGQDFGGRGHLQGSHGL